MAVRTPITGITMASAPSISSCNRVVVVKVMPFRASFFGQGGNVSVYFEITEIGFS
ncbi:hypothetical protein KY290_007063 [Solanum tuberosum]|uniref:Uncharacterized protein n=1 Tax=Solanum tuberosum TaxID=4113 RepID=A0ABQ7W743_SOLTU|nr:hypothetical protein KY289_007406 [Solanum tuberosum]KAH0714205.1 hypothetical protein KY284_007110 [Solanum tuberosum]KAH0775652.1 hypothetical protein KY290_007063 [Solanum tuberosum]